MRLNRSPGSFLVCWSEVSKRCKPRCGDEHTLIISLVSRASRSVFRFCPAVNLHNSAGIYVTKVNIAMTSSKCFGYVTLLPPTCLFFDAPLLDCLTIKRYPDLSKCFLYRHVSNKFNNASINYWILRAVVASHTDFLAPSVNKLRSIYCEYFLQSLKAVGGSVRSQKL